MTRLSPADAQAEADRATARRFIGCVLASPFAAGAQADALADAGLWPDPETGQAAALASRLVADGREPSMLAVAEAALRAGADLALGELARWCDEPDPPAALPRLRDVLTDAAARRRLRACAVAIRGACDEGQPPSAILPLWRPELSAARGPRHVGDVASELYGAILDRVDRRARGETVGVPCPWEGVGRSIAPSPGHLVVMAGRPGQGKTAAALQWTARVCEEGGSVLYFSLEMTAPELLCRLALPVMRAGGCEVNGTDLLRGEVPGEALAALNDALAIVQGWPLWIDDTPRRTGAEIRGRVAAQSAVGPLGMVVVDHIGLCGGIGRDRVNELADLTGSLKAAAKAHGTMILALSQLNRQVEARTPPRPMLADLRDSGAIEQDADSVIMLWRPGYYELPGAGHLDAELVVAKARHGRPGTITADFHGSRQVFAEAHRDPWTQPAATPARPSSPGPNGEAGAWRPRARA